MISISTAVFALAAINSVAAVPFKGVSRDVCGTVPSVTGSQTPLETFTDALTAQACAADCDANPSCQSFLFGMVNGVVKCELFSVPAAQIPAQASANLVAYDKACTSIPAVKPTTANPKGLAIGTTDSQGQTGSGNTIEQQQGQTQGSQKQSKRDTCGAAPTGSGSAQPLNTPANIDSLAACIAACKANPTCKR